MSDLRYAVVLAGLDAYRPVEIARALAPLLKVPEQDLVPRARSSWGLIEEDASEERAKEVREALEKAGVPALAVPRALIEELPQAKVTPVMLSCEPKRLVVLGAAAFKQIQTRRVKTTEGPDLTQRAINIGVSLATGIPLGLGGKKQEVERTVENTELVFYLDLCLRDPAERVRIDAQDFDFSCLGARKSYSAAVNFRQLVFDLADASPAARRTRGATILLEQKPVREMGYESLADLERECRWLATLAALNK